MFWANEKICIHTPGPTFCTHRESFAFFWGGVQPLPGEGEVYVRQRAQDIGCDDLACQFGLGEEAKDLRERGFVPDGSKRSGGPGADFGILRGEGGEQGWGGGGVSELTKRFRRHGVQAAIAALQGGEERRDRGAVAQHPQRRDHRLEEGEVSSFAFGEDEEVEEDRKDARPSQPSQGLDHSDLPVSLRETGDEERHGSRVAKLSQRLHGGDGEMNSFASGGLSQGPYRFREPKLSQGERRRHRQALFFGEEGVYEGAHRLFIPQATEEAGGFGVLLGEEGAPEHLGFLFCRTQRGEGAGCCKAHRLGGVLEEGL